MTSDPNVEIAQMQQAIADHFGYPAGNMVFDFSELPEGQVRLDVITINPRHRQSFLFHTVSGHSKGDCLQRMMEYVRDYKESESSYTIQWTLKGENELHTSYFRAANIMTAIEKLYHDRDPNSITIFSVVLNPIA